MEPVLRRLWWKRKRCALVVAVWILPAWLASHGPAVYFVTRGWMPKGLFEAVYIAPHRFVPMPESVDDAFGYHLTWCRDEAWIHMGRPVDPDNR